MNKERVLIWFLFIWHFNFKQLTFVSTLDAHGSHYSQSNKQVSIGVRTWEYCGFIAQFTNYKTDLFAKESNFLFDFTLWLTVLK